MEEVKGMAVEEVKVETATGPVKKKKNAKKAKGKVPIDQVVERFLKSSKCISEEEAKKKSFLIEVLKDEEVEAKMIYQASKDGWMPTDFHERCDFAGATLTLMKLADDGPCIGGFTRE